MAAAEPAPADPGMGNSAAPAEPQAEPSEAITEKPSVTEAFGAALFKGISEGASGAP